MLSEAFRLWLGPHPGTSRSCRVAVVEPELSLTVDLGLGAPLGSATDSVSLRVRKDGLALSPSSPSTARPGTSGGGEVSGGVLVPASRALHPLAGAVDIPGDSLGLRRGASSSSESPGSFPLGQQVSGSPWQVSQASPSLNHEETEVPSRDPWPLRGLARESWCDPPHPFSEARW